MAAQNLDEDTVAEAAANRRQYRRARTATNVALAVFAASATFVGLVDPAHYRSPKGEPNPLAMAEVVAEVTMWIAVFTAYALHGRMAEARGWLRATLGTEPPFGDAGPAPRGSGAA